MYHLVITLPECAMRHGKITDDKDLQSEGKLDKAKGDIHSAAGDVKDATAS